MTIDLSTFSFEQLEELETQIQKYKKLNIMEAYKVSFYVKFNPEKHKEDMLTLDGEVDECGCFWDYIVDNIGPMIRSDFYLDGEQERVCGIQVALVPKQDVHNL